MFNYMRRNKIINGIARYLKHILYLNAQYKTKKVLRLLFPAHNQYSNLKKFKDIHKGGRCFILATGPSLTLEDVSKLKDEITFGMNSICFLFKDLGWETTYYGVQDLAVYEKLKHEYKKLKSTEIFLGDAIPKTERKEINHIPYPLNYLNHRYTYDKLATKFSTNFALEVFDGYTITYTLMQLAVYMGFKEIYLLGNDCSYSKDPKKQHFVDFGHYCPSTLTARDRILFAYQYAYDFLKGTDVKIYNATRGGALEIFPRVDLDEVLKKENDYNQ